MSNYRTDAIHNGQRFFDTWGGEIRWVEDSGQWVVYRASEGRWVPSEEDVREMGKLVVEDMYEEAMHALDVATTPQQEAAAKLKLKWAKQTADSQFDRMIKMASSIGGIRARVVEFDSQPNLLNTPDGVWDLTTGLSIDQFTAPALLLTKRTTVSPSTWWEGGLWDHFLRYVCPDEEARNYLQLCTGYMAFAGVEERLILFLLGETGCGKSKFVESIQRAMGDYAVSLATDQLLVGAKDTYGLARLPGARMIQAAEFEEGQKINTALVKRITSGEPVTVRMAYGKPFDYNPVGTIIISTNKLPWLGDDEAGWRRVRAVPFNQPLELYTVTELDEKLKKCTDQILAWIVEGARKYWETASSQGTKLNPPQSVISATQDEKQDQRHYVMHMIEECFDGDTTVFQESSDIYSVLKIWCIEKGFRDADIIRSDWMGRKLRGGGVPGWRTNKARWWGVGRLRSDAKISTLMFGPSALDRMAVGIRRMV